MILTITLRLLIQHDLRTKQC